MFAVFAFAQSENCRLSEYTNDTVSPSYCSMIALLTKKGF